MFHQNVLYCLEVFRKKFTEYLLLIYATIKSVVKLRGSGQVGGAGDVGEVSLSSGFKLRINITLAFFLIMHEQFFTIS